MPNSRLFSKY